MPRLLLARLSWSRVANRICRYSPLVWNDNEVFSSGHAFPLDAAQQAHCQ
jgi:hypothetical protein